MLMNLIVHSHHIQANEQALVLLCEPLNTRSTFNFSSLDLNADHVPCSTVALGSSSYLPQTTVTKTGATGIPNKAMHGRDEEVCMESTSPRAPRGVHPITRVCEQEVCGEW